MFRPGYFAVASVLVTLMGGSAHAALTADKVWQSWKDGAAPLDLEVSAATEAKSGSTLSLNGVSFAAKQGPVLLKISDLSLTENSDGSVTITPGADIGSDYEDGDTRGTVNINHSDLVILASEDEDGAIVYEYSADRVDVIYDLESPGFSMEEGQEAAPGKDAGRVTFSELEGSYIDTPGETRILAMAIAASELSYEVSSDHPSLDMSSSQKSVVSQIEAAGAVTLPTGPDFQRATENGDFAGMLQQGFAVALEGTQGPSTSSSTAEDPFFPHKMEMDAAAGTFAFSLDETSFHLESAMPETTTLQVTLPGSEEAYGVAIEDMAMVLTSPMLAPTEPGDYQVALKLGSLSVDEAIWGMFDPAGNLERGPLHLDLNLTGKMIVDLAAIMSSDLSEGPGVTPEPVSLNIEAANLAVAGAELNAGGALTFDNSMGIPAPLGEATIDISGTEKLIGGLIGMGIITEEDAMMAKMMMGAFMVPGSEPDSLTSKIEFREGFQIFANGQQIQ